MGVIAKGIPRGCQGLFTPVSLRYPLSVFNKNSTLKEKGGGREGRKGGGEIVFVCACVCVCEKESEREKEIERNREKGVGGGQRERERGGERSSVQRICVCFGEREGVVWL